MRKKSAPLEDNLENGRLVITKEADGKYRWIGYSSNAFRDRANDIIATSALERDVERADELNYYGPLRWWHVKGMDIGSTDFRAMKGRVLIESGEIFDNDIAKSIMAQQKNLQMSVGFFHPGDEPKNGRVFQNVFIFERSILPAGYAANDLTKFSVKGANMKMPLKAKIKAFGALLKDEALLTRVLDNADKIEGFAEALGKDFKEAEKEDVEINDEFEAKIANLFKEEKEKDPEKEKEEEKTDGDGEDETDSEDEEEGEKEAEEKDLPLDKVLGEMTAKEFSGVLEIALKEHTAELTTSLEKATKEVETLTGRVVKLEAANTAQSGELKEAKKALKELTADLPAAVKQFIATEDKETELDETDEEHKKLKEKTKETDKPKTSGFFEFALGQKQ